MTDDHVRVQFAAYYVFQQCRQQRVYMGLTHLEGQPLVEGVSEQESVDEAGVYPGHADRAASAYDGYALTQGLADAAFELEVLEDGFGGAALGLETHSVDGRINAAVTRGLLDDGVGRIVVLVEIDRYDPVGTGGELQAVLVVIDHVDILGPQQTCTGGGHQPHRAGAEDGQRAARPHAGVDHRLITGRQDIGHEQHLFVIQLLGKTEGARIGLRHPHILRLPARDAAIQVAVAEQGSPGGDLLLVQNRASSGVGGLAGGVQVHVAEEAAAAGDHEGHYDPLALAHSGYAPAGFHHFAEEFVAEDVTLLHLRNGAAIQVQVGAADRRGGNPQNDVVILQNGRIRYRFDADIMTAVVSKCAHALLLWLDQGW